MGMTGSSDQIWDMKTTSNSWTTIYTQAIGNTDRTAIIRGSIDSFAPSSGDALQGTLRTMVRRDSGTPGAIFAAIFDLLNVQKTVGALLWDVRATVSGTDVLVQVKGKASADTFWRIDGLAITFQDASF